MMAVENVIEAGLWNLCGNLANAGHASRGTLHPLQCATLRLLIGDVLCGTCPCGHAHNIPIERQPQLAPELFDLCRDTSIERAFRNGRGCFLIPRLSPGHVLLILRCICFRESPVWQGGSRPGLSLLIEFDPELGEVVEVATEAETRASAFE